MTWRGGTLRALSNATDASGRPTRLAVLGGCDVKAPKDSFRIVPIRRPTPRQRSAGRRGGGGPASFRSARASRARAAVGRSPTSSRARNGQGAASLAPRTASCSGTASDYCGRPPDGRNTDEGCTRPRPSLTFTTRATSAAPARAATHAPCDGERSHGCSVGALARRSEDRHHRMPEIPRLARLDPLPTPGAVVEADRDRRGQRLPLSAVRLGVSRPIGLPLPASPSCFPLRHHTGERNP